MKLKPTFLIALCLLFAACSCDNDDDNIKTIELTETNYFYENDAYIFALNVEKQSLLDYINNPNDPNYDQGQAEEAEARVEEINSIIEGTITGVMRGFPPIPPPPPICFCWDVWNESKYLVMDDSTFAFEATVTNANQEVLYQTNTLEENFNINGFDVEAQAFSFQEAQQGYNGSAILNITKVINQGDAPISYSLPIFIE